MIQKFCNKNNQRGEVAWLLTVVSMVVIGFGLVIGFNINTQEQAALRLAPQAQTTSPTPDSKQPTNHHNICFREEDGKKVAPGTGNDLFDKLCEANFLPFKITVDSKGTPSIKARASQNKAENPTFLTNQSRIITTPSITNTNISVSGALCVKSNVGFDPADLVNTDVFTSAVAADPEDPTTIGTQVKNYKIAGTSGPERDSSARNFLKLADDNKEVCTYDFDKTSPSQPVNATNPILLKLFMNKGTLGKIDATIIGQIERAKADGKWDADECSIYIHADTNPGDSIDVYNIAKLDLRKFLTSEEVNQLCPPEIVTPPMETPTPTITQAPLSCTDSCTPSADCGTYSDPVTGTEEQLKCLSRGATLTDLCTETSGAGCTCAPMKCVGPNGVCSDEVLACGQDAPTPTASVTPVPPTPTVTEEPPVTPQAMQCTYNALAFVEECLKVNQDTGKCELKGARKNAQAFAGNILDPNPAVLDRSDKWGTSNNLQRNNVVSAGNPTGLRQPGMIPATIFEFADGSKVNSLRNTFFNFPFNTSSAQGGGIAYDPMSTIFVTSSQSVPTKLTDKAAQIKDLLRRRSDIKIHTDAELPKDNPAMYQKEQYTNFSQADVKLHYDTDQYRILPGGKELYNCSNTLAAQLDPSDPDFLKSQGTNSCIPESSEEQKELDTMHGLMVGCGQNIVYGWTLQKCNFDFDIVFVVDTSSSMTYDKSGTQRKKIDIAKDQLKEFVDFALANYGSKTRVSLVTFNAATSYSPATGTTDGGKGKVTADFVALKNNDTDANVAGIANFKASIDGLPTQEGTCIQCGLRNAQDLLAKRSEPDLRLPVVVFLSDGRPNSFPHATPQKPVLGQTDPNPGDETTEIYNLADAIRADGVKTNATGARSIGDNSVIKDDVLFLAFGYGDAKLAIDNNDGMLFDLLNGMVSYRRNSKKEFDLQNRWIYTTDRGTDSDEIQVQSIVGQIKKDLNTCSQLGLAYDNVQKAKDVNVDGIVNITDLFLVFDNYFAKGQSLKEDINGDGVVNINDITLIVESLGTVVTPVDNNPITGATQPTQ